MKKLPIYTSAITLLFLNVPVNANVLPTGGIAISGGSNIYNNGYSTYISSQNNKNVISWESFSVGKNNTVVFDDKAYLNIVRGPSASVIDGKVQAMDGGKIYLVNPNGITIGVDGSIKADKVILSTSKLSQKAVENFIDSGDLILDKKGMGKIKLIGKLSADNVVIDGSQIIIRDIENIQNSNQTALINEGNNSIEIVSSTNRIDVGGRSGIDFENDYKLTTEQGLVDQTGKIAISTKDELLAIGNDLANDYFITNDLDLGDLSAPIVQTQQVFSGSIDGAFNQITFNLSAQGKDNVGLFDSLNNATIENLKITDPTIEVISPNNNSNIGVLAGSITNSKLHNLQIDNANFIFSNLSNNNAYVGGLSGLMTGSSNELSNVSVSFTDLSLDRFNNYLANLNTGFIAGKVTGSIVDNGFVFSKQQDKLNAFYDNSLNVSLGKGDLANNLDYVQFDGGYELKDFYCPFFVDSNQEYIYDDNWSYDYLSNLNNPYFNAQDYVNLELNYQGQIHDIGNYLHTYSNKVNGTTFYFVQDGKAYSTLAHSISVVKMPVQAPDVEALKPQLPSFNYDDNQTVALFKYDNKKVNTRLSFTNPNRTFAKIYNQKLLASLKIQDTDNLAYNFEDEEQKV